MKGHPLLALILPSLGTEQDVAKTVRSLEPLADKLQLIITGDLQLEGVFPHLVHLKGGQLDTYSRLLNAALPHLHAWHCLVTQFKPAP